jgi:nucleotide-binding universal stress UspA family protein
MGSSALRWSGASRSARSERRRSPVGKAMFGSVTQSVILGTDRSVLVCSGGDAD